MSGVRLDRARFVRQMLLPEIGERGQHAIGQARAAVPPEGLAREVGERYARGAGFGAIAPEPAASEGSDESTAWVSEPSARAVLEGARAVQRAILAAVPNARASGPLGRDRGA